MGVMIDIFRSLGLSDGQALRAEAASLTDTQLIERERCIPAFDPAKDYTGLPVGTPVQDGGQVWKLLQPHNAAHYEGRPADLRALWGLCHTKNPARAKPWMDALGTSGMYMAGECYRADDGTVYRALQDNLVHGAAALPSAWEVAE